MSIHFVPFSCTAVRSRCLGYLAAIQQRPHEDLAYNHFKVPFLYTVQVLAILTTCDSRRCLGNLVAIKQHSTSNHFELLLTMSDITMQVLPIQPPDYMWLNRCNCYILYSTCTLHVTCGIKVWTPSFSLIEIVAVLSSPGEMLDTLVLAVEMVAVKVSGSGPSYSSSLITMIITVAVVLPAGNVTL